MAAFITRVMFKDLPQMYQESQSFAWEWSHAGTRVLTSFIGQVSSQI